MEGSAEPAELAGSAVMPIPLRSKVVQTIFSLVSLWAVPLLLLQQGARAEMELLARREVVVPVPKATVGPAVSAEPVEHQERQAIYQSRLPVAT
jgi:hypothetical protein